MYKNEDKMPTSSTPNTNASIVSSSYHGGVGRMVINRYNNAIVRFQLRHQLAFQYIPNVNMTILWAADSMCIRVR